MSWPDAAVVEVETADDALLAWRVVNTFMHVKFNWARDAGSGTDAEGRPRCQAKPATSRLNWIDNDCT